jgi:hypothetical protein
VTTREDGSSPPGVPAGFGPAGPPAVPASASVPAPGGSPVAARVAAADRRTSRRGVVVGVLVVLVGGVVGYAGGQLLSTRSQVVALARDVPVGSAVSAEDLTTARVGPDRSLAPIPASELPRLVGLVAQVGLVRGELLTRSQLGAGSGFAPGQQLVALPLRQGQFPARGLSPGQQVRVVGTPGQGGTAAASAAAGSGLAGSAVQATVVDVGGLNPATGLTVVDVVVAAADGTRVAQLASTGDLAVILLPAGR